MAYTVFNVEHICFIGAWVWSDVKRNKRVLDLRGLAPQSDVRDCLSKSWTGFHACKNEYLQLFNLIMSVQFIWVLLCPLRNDSINYSLMQYYYDALQL